MAADIGVEPRGARPQPPAPPDIPWLEIGEPAIAPPAIHWLEGGVPPIAWPCEGGWPQVEVDGVGTCEPYGPEGPEACREGEAHFPGEESCRPIGRPCGDGPFADTSDLLEGTPLVYALDGAAPGGDGTREAPVGTLADALDLAEPGAVVMLGTGAYEVDRTWPDGVSLRGRCVRETSLVPAAESDRTAIVDVARHDAPVRLESIRIGPGEAGGLRVRRRGAPVALEGIEIAQISEVMAGLLVTSAARVQARSLVVRDIGGIGRDRFTGFGISVDAGGRLTLERALVARNQEAGIGVFLEGSELTASDVRITGTRGVTGTRVGGVGLRVELGAEVALDRALIDGNRYAGILLLGPDARLVGKGIIVRDTLPQEADDRLGYGLSVDEGGAVELNGTLMEGNHGVGLSMDDGSTGALTDVVIRDTESELASGEGGRGVNVTGGSRATLQRVILENNREVGLFASDAETEVTATDLVIRRTRGRKRDDAGGAGVNGQEDARLVLRRTLLERNALWDLSSVDRATLVAEDLVARDGQGDPSVPLMAGVAVVDARLELRRAVLQRNPNRGISVVGSGTTARVEDLQVRETVGVSPEAAGVLVGAEADLTLERALVDRSAYTGLRLAGRSAASVGDLVVRDTQPIEATDTGGGGHGVEVRSGSCIDLSRTLVEGSRLTAVDFDGMGAEGVLRDLVVRDTLPQAGTSPIAAPGEFGRGLEVRFGARIELTRALFERNHDVAVVMAGGGTVGRIEDLHVRETRPQALDGTAGLGVVGYRSADIVLERVLVEDCRSLGVELALDVRADVTDLVVRRTRSQESDGAWGRGLTVAADSNLTLRRARLEDNREIGFAAFGRGTVAELTDVEVRNTRAPDCDPACSMRPAGVSLGAYDGADVAASHVRLEGGASCGVQGAGDAQVCLAGGAVRGHPIGICLDDGNYPLSKLRQRVVYEGNGTLLDTGDIVVPDPGTVFP